MYAAENDDVRFGGCRRLAEAQGVAREIRYLLNL
jgi:hypothetical protein